MRKRRLGWVCMALGVLCILSAALLALHNRRQAENAAAAAQRTLTRMAETIVSDRQEADDDGGIQVEGERYLGFLSLPAIGVELPVRMEWDMEGLKTAPARYAGSLEGGLVIGAHNYAAHFGGLSRLRQGDTVYLTDGAGALHCYTVERIETLAPESVAEMTDSGWELTLFTCTYGGQNRVTVRCRAAEENRQG